MFCSAKNDFRTNCLDSSYYQIDTLIDPVGPAKLYRCNVLVQYKQTKIWFFIVYLGLLINLGPSLHHADFLGLHVHSSSVSSCGCCHSHSGSHSHHHSGSSNELTANGSAEHDCALCKFFDQYHVIVDAVDFQECSALAVLMVAERPAEQYSASFIPVARGPPATA